MTTPPLAGVVAATIAVLLAIATFATTMLSADPTTVTCAPASSTSNATPARWGSIGPYRSEQVTAAATIVTVGAQMGVPTAVWSSP